MAVEVRSWMQREMDVDVPVLRILGDTSVRDLVGLAHEKLPAESIPNLGQPGNAHLPAIGTLRNESVMALALSDPAPASTKLLRDSEKSGCSPPSQENRSPISNSSNSKLRSDKASSTGLGDQLDAESSKTSDSASWQGLNFSQKSMKPSLSTSFPISTPLSIPEIEKTVPMSWSQSRFWVMNQIVQEPSAFNVSCLLEITGELEPDILTEAVMRLGMRHEGLRTCFFDEESQGPVQGVLKNSPLQLEILETSASIQNEFRALQQHLYDLTKGETIRILLCSPSSSQHYLLVGYHHINMDSTSLAVLINDLHRLYSGKQPLPVQLQYPEFTIYQLEQFRNGHWDDILTFWRQEFSSLPDPLPILNVSHNTSHPRLTLTSYANKQAETRLSKKVTDQVLTLSRNLRVTPFHVYCATFQILLARLAALDEVCIGFADANRSVPRAMNSIGNFLNLLPLRLSSTPGQLFSSLVKETKGKILSALAHSAAPFDVILDEVGVPRSPTHNPLFQAFIDYRSVDEVQQFGKAQLKANEYALSKTPYDIMLDIIDPPTGATSVNVMTQEGLYTAEEADLLLKCYINLLTRLTGDKDLAVGGVGIFDFQELDQALRLGQGMPST